MRAMGERDGMERCEGCTTWERKAAEGERTLCHVCKRSARDLRAGLNSEEWGAVRDALEMRSKECRKLVAELSSGVGRGRSVVERRLALSFKVTADRCDKLLSRLEGMDVV